MDLVYTYELGIGPCKRQPQRCQGLVSLAPPRLERVLRRRRLVAFRLNRLGDKVRLRHLLRRFLRLGLRRLLRPRPKRSDLSLLGKPDSSRAWAILIRAELYALVFLGSQYLRASTCAFALRMCDPGEPTGLQVCAPVPGTGGYCWVYALDVTFWR